MDDLATKRRLFTTRERKNNGRYPFHYFEDSKWEIKKKKFSKRNDFFPKERHASLRQKGINDPSRRKMPLRFVIPSPISPKQEWHVVKHTKFP